MQTPPETNQPTTTEQTADDEPERSLTTLPPAASDAVIPFKGKPGSPQMVDPEGKIRSGQFRGNARIARHPSHRPYEKD